MDAKTGSRGGIGGGFRFVDLFSGIGGFRLALESLGGRCVMSSDIEHPRGSRIEIILANGRRATSGRFGQRTFRSTTFFAEVFHAKLFQFAEKN